MKLKENDKAVITANESRHEFQIGEKVKIVNVGSRDYYAEGGSVQGWYITDNECKLAK